MGLLMQACAGLDRLTPEQALEEQRNGALLVDVRTAHQRAATADLPGAIVIDLTILPWRLDPSVPWCIAEASTWDRRWILICRQGYSSAIAAWNLRQMGVSRATDIVGGFEAWASAGLPTMTGPIDERF